MKAEEVFAALRALPILTLERALPTGPVVIVAPHPDDESLGCGGLITQAVTSGRDVHLVFITDGTGSHRNSVAYPSTRLRALRESEARKAARVLGLPDDGLSFLRVTDGSAPTVGQIAECAIGQLVEILDKVCAQSLFVTWWGDPHCDHKAAFSLAQAAARRGTHVPKLFSYIVWGWTLSGDTELPLGAISGFRLDIMKEMERKRNAIAQHMSQTTRLIDDDPTGFRLTQADITRSCGAYETFIEEATDER